MKSILFAALMLCMAWTAHAETAASYPNKAVRIHVGFAPGGGTDLLARFYAKRLGEKLGQPFVVENRPGKGGGIAVQATANAAPNGYTLVVGTTGVAVDAALGESSYDWKRDLAPVALLAYSANVVVVAEKSGIHSIADLVREARQRHVTFGSAGYTTSMHMSGELFEQMAGVDLTHVPYRGAAPAEQALLSGEVDVLFDNIAGAVSFIQAGKFRPLAVTSATRNPHLPQVPTMAEAGLKGYETVGTFFLMAPAGTPAPILGLLEKTVQQITAEPQTQDYVKRLNMVPLSGGSAAVTQMLTGEHAKWKKVVGMPGFSVSR